MRTVKIPDGKGGWSEVEVDESMQGGETDPERQAEAMKAQFYVDAGTLTEKLARFATVYCKDMGLQPEHLAFAVALFCINLREDFPRGSGGKEGFDKQSAAAAEYYDINTGGAA